MPRKPKRPCSYPGCPELTDDRYCEQHQSLVNKQYNKYQRDPESNKRYGRSWKRIRDRYIKTHPLCEECQRQGRLTPAEEVHHIIPLANGGSNNKENLMSLCKSCHSRITAQSGDRWGRSNLYTF
jgi:5-methylcytosine-specific restriction protein A